MRYRLINEPYYPFSWLDEVIEVTLNPEKTNLKSLVRDQLEQIGDRLPEEISSILNNMKSQAFSLYITDQLKVVAGHYDQSIRVLRQQALENQRQYPKTGLLNKLGQLIIAALEQLSGSIHHRFSHYLPEVPPDDHKDLPLPASTLHKIVCALSADQLGIVLRAAFDVKVIIGKSFRKVCQAMAPYLSTIWKTSVSWDSIRSNAGRAETRDKDIAIAALEKMIEMIRGYR